MSSSHSCAAQNMAVLLWPHMTGPNFWTSGTESFLDWKSTTTLSSSHQERFMHVSPVLLTAKWSNCWREKRSQITASHLSSPPWACQSNDSSISSMRLENLSLKNIETLCVQHPLHCGCNSNSINLWNFPGLSLCGHHINHPSTEKERQTTEIAPRVGSKESKGQWQLLLCYQTCMKAVY